MAPSRVAPAHRLLRGVDSYFSHRTLLLGLDWFPRLPVASRQKLQAVGKPASEISGKNLNKHGVVVGAQPFQHYMLGEMPASSRHEFELSQVTRVGLLGSHVH